MRPSVRRATPLTKYSPSTACTILSGSGHEGWNTCRIRTITVEASGEPGRIVNYTRMPRVTPPT